MNILGTLWKRIGWWFTWNNKCKGEYHVVFKMDKGLVNGGGDVFFQVVVGSYQLPVCLVWEGLAHQSKDLFALNSSG